MSESTALARIELERDSPLARLIRGVVSLCGYDLADEGTTGFSLLLCAQSHFGTGGAGATIAMPGGDNPLILVVAQRQLSPRWRDHLQEVVRAEAIRLAPDIRVNALVMPEQIDGFSPESLAQLIGYLATARAITGQTLDAQSS